MQEVRLQYHDWKEDMHGTRFILEGDHIALDLPDSQETANGRWYIETLAPPEVIYALCL